MLSLCEGGGVGCLVFLMKKTFSVLLLLCLGVVQAETFWLEGVDRYSGWSDFNKKDPEAADGDNNLCWAASASNVINWWQNHYVTPADAPTGEDIWTTFKQSANGDVGGHVMGAMQWWLTGWYSHDNSPDAIQYAGFAMANEAIRNKTIYNKDHFEGYYRYLEENLESEFVNPWFDHLTDFMASADVGVHVGNEKSEYASMSSTLRDAIEGGAGVSVILQTEDGGHAVTLWGADFNQEGNLIGMWLTDSDDNQYGKHEDSGLFYAAMGEGSITMQTDLSDGTKENKVYYQVTTESGWYGQTTYLYNFAFFDTSVSDTWGLQLVPESSTATLGLLALVGLAGRRRRR